MPTRELHASKARVLRPYQKEAVTSLFLEDTPLSGIVKAAAGAGKTVIGAAALQKLATLRGAPTKAVWLAHTREQLDQAKAAVGAFPDANLTVEFFCYAAYPYVGDADIVVADECHRLPAATFRKIVDGYTGVRWGLSATPEREDDLRRDVFDLIGEVLYAIDRQVLIDAGFLCPCEVVFLEVNDRDEFEPVVSEIADKLIAERRRKWPILFANPVSANEQIRRATWQAVLQEAIHNNPARDAAIVDICRAHTDAVTLIIVGSVAHGESLAEKIPGAVVCHSKVKGRAKIMTDARAGKIPVLIATSLADEGLDLPIASVLILAAPSKSKGKAEQRTGRVLRTMEAKTHGIVYDFNDIQHSYLASQAASRFRTYEKLGYKISVKKFEHSSLR